MLNTRTHQPWIPAGLAPDHDSHMHSAGFSHKSKKKRPRLREADELVERTPQKDANVNEVHAWVLEIFRRRCHPEPEAALQDFYWKGTDLHSQRRYLALRLRFRREPYGYMIAHDIHDALKESRKRTRRRERKARKQPRKKNKSGPGSTPKSSVTPGAQQSHASTSGPNETNTACLIETDSPKVGDKTQAKNPIPSKAKQTLLKIFIITRQKKTTSSGKGQEMSCSPRGPDSLFQDPASESPRAKKEKKQKQMPLRSRKKSKSASRSDSELPQDPFRDPEMDPMRLIDADDFRIDSPQDSADFSFVADVSPSSTVLDPWKRKGRGRNRGQDGWIRCAFEFVVSSGYVMAYNLQSSLCLQWAQMKTEV
ncbi:hypothetical protein GGS21DRAFT_492371 [Xylaria nigripes]|nr:hypothetical protein GGS21DRAFT_492371 [Xylaria nigripes]